MSDEALRSLKTLFVGSLALLALWFLNWPAAVERLELYRQARDLQAWILLRELAGHPELDVHAFDPAESIDHLEVDRASPTPQGGDYVERVDLVVESVWPAQRRYPVTLRPETFYAEEDPTVAGRARIYRVEAPPGDLPLGDYLLVFVDALRMVVPAGDPAFAADARLGLRMVQVAAAARNRPRHWTALAGRLRALGFAGAPRQLSPADAALARLQADSDPRQRGVQVLGMPLSIGLFYSAVGVLLAIVAFGGLGPLRLLGRATGPSRDPWILSLPRAAGARGAVLEACVGAVSLAWALAPLVILVLQIRSRAPLAGAHLWAVRLGAAGLVFSSAVFGTAALQLHRLRQRPANS
jgi:hypothetical protein